MKVNVKFISAFLALFYILTFSITVYAGTSPSNLSDVGKSRAKELYQYMISNGYTPEAACGVLGNADQESSFEISIDYSGTYKGTFQFVADVANAIKSYAKTNNLDPDNSTVQFTWIEANKLEGDFKTYTDITLDEFKKIKDTSEATDAFCAAYERCIRGVGKEKEDDDKAQHSTYDGGTRYYQELKTRRKYAKEFLSEYAGIEAVDSEGTNQEGDGTSGIVVTNGTFGIVDPVSGMFTSLTEVALNFPSKEDLDENQLKGVVDWKNNIDYESEDSLVKYLRVFVMLSGIVFLVWIVLIYLSYWFDRINNFVDIELLPTITGGKLRISPEEFDCTFNPKSFVKGQAQTVNHKVVICICLIGLFFSVFVISGYFYTVLNYLVRKMLGFLGQV